MKRPGAKTCALCGSSFDRPHWPAPRWRAARFCSVSCMSQWREQEKRKDAPGQFLDGFIPEPNSGCWLWTGTLHKSGYGQVQINGVLHRAHRFSYELHKGQIPTGLGVLHNCDTRCCVNPDHLYVGTAADNAADAVRRGRNTRGEMQGSAKLTEADVRAIRVSAGTDAEVARQFGISRPVVNKVRKRQLWGHVQ